jgi:hypothetical protein
MNFFEAAAARAEEFTWVTCPACQSDFTGLFDIHFSDDSGARRHIQICGGCKNFVPGIEYARSFLPLRGSIVTRRQMGAFYDRMSLAGLIEFQGHVVTVLPHAAGGFRFKLANDPENKTHRGDDCFEVWTLIRTILQSKETKAIALPAEKKGFGNLNGFNYDQI